MILPRIDQILNELEKHAQEYAELNAERLELDNRNREIRKRLDELKKTIQAVVGTAETLNVPHVAQIGHYYVVQIKKAREVKAYSYEYIDFNVTPEDA